MKKKKIKKINEEKTKKGRKKRFEKSKKEKKKEKYYTRSLDPKNHLQTVLRTVLRPKLKKTY